MKTITMSIVREDIRRYIDNTADFDFSYRPIRGLFEAAWDTAHDLEHSEDEAVERWEQPIYDWATHVDGFAELPVRCINDQLDDGFVYDSLAAMYESYASDPQTRSWVPEDGFVEGRDYEEVEYDDTPHHTLLMEPHTGTVAPKEVWEEDYRTMTAEEWGGEKFEDAGLIEVVPDGEGGFKEVK